jgi:hypothetical protein
MAAGCACAAILWKALLSIAAPSAAFAATRAAMVSLVFLFLYLGAIVILHGGFAPLRQMWQLLPHLVPGDRRRTPARAAVQAELLDHAVGADR